MKKSEFKASDSIITVVIVCVACFVIILLSVYPIPSVALSGGIVAIFSALTGVWITIAVTRLLLRRQSETQAALQNEQFELQQKFQKELMNEKAKHEHEKEIGTKIFEEKLKIYKEFLSKLQEIIKDKTISDDNVKSLIFQISYIAMHTSSERVDRILSRLGDTINEIGSDEKKYEKLANNILDIVLEMQHELYKKRLGEKEIDTKVFETLLTYIEDATEISQEVSQPSKDITGNDYKIELQTYFWTELMKQLKLKNPNYTFSWTEEDVMGEVVGYYAKKRNRYRYFGFGFEIYTSQKLNRSVWFRVEIENCFYYGIRWADNPISDATLSQIVRQVSPAYITSGNGYIWHRWPDSSNDKTRHDLDFWKFGQHTGMKRLMDPTKREELMKEIADEMYGQISTFIEIAQKNGL